MSTEKNQLDLVSHHIAERIKWGNEEIEDVASHTYVPTKIINCPYYKTLDAVCAVPSSLLKLYAWVVDHIKKY